MNRLTVRSRALIGTTAFCLATVLRLPAQTTAPATTGSATEENEEVLILSPFVVSAEEDAGSYRATSTLAGSRIRTELRDVASPISVVTAKFLKDTASNNNQDLLTYTTSTEVGGLFGTGAASATPRASATAAPCCSPTRTPACAAWNRRTAR